MLLAIPTKILLIIAVFVVVAVIAFIIFWGALSGKRDEVGTPTPTPPEED